MGRLTEVLVGTALTNDGGQQHVLVKPPSAEWTAVATLINATVAVSKVGVANKEHRVTAISASYDAAAIGLLSWGGTAAAMRGHHTVHNAAHLTFGDGGLKIGIGSSAVFSLASATSKTGMLTVVGYTV